MGFVVLSLWFRRLGRVEWLEENACLDVWGGGCGGWFGGYASCDGE